MRNGSTVQSSMGRLVKVQRKWEVPESVNPESGLDVPRVPRIPKGQLPFAPFHGRHNARGTT